MNLKYFKPHQLISFLLGITVLLSIVSSWIEAELEQLPAISKINGLVHAGSTLSLVVLTFLFVERVGWKWGLFKWLIDLPDLNGRYKGELISSFLDASGNPVVKDCVIEIRQTASAIHVYSYFGDRGTNVQTSRAFSVSEQIIKENNGLFKLYYIFSNEPDTMQTLLNNHSGTASFEYYPDKKSLKGSYYNQRKNLGTIEVKFEQENLLGRLAK